MSYLELIIVFLLGLIVGFAVAWFIKTKELEYRKKSLEELENKFKAMTADIFSQNSENFLRLAGTKFGGTEENVKKLVESVNKSVKEVEEKVSQLEKDRSEQVGILTQNVKHVLDAGIEVNKAAVTIKTALSSSGSTIGNWGEGVLKSLLEESGLTEGVNFFVQETVSGEESFLRPDIIINLPGEFRLAVDSKASLAEFNKAVEEPERKTEHIESFVTSLRKRIKDLSGKEYQKYLDPRIPYAIMFIPGEAAIRAAFEQDTDLYREAQERKVVLASPYTIMPLIFLIVHAWKQYKSTINAAKLSEEVTELGDRLKLFFSHMGGIGQNISQATKRFNDAVGSFESRVLPKINQINTLGGSVRVDEEMKIIEEEPRAPKKLTTPKK
ncbi:MAG: DNA recombination protein RmuC [Patescibacteria group bacterium]